MLARCAGLVSKQQQLAAVAAGVVLRTSVVASAKCSPIVNQRYNADPSEKKPPVRYPPPRYVDEVGVDLLHSPLYNKGTGYTIPERDRLRLRGMVPPRTMSIEDQIERIMRRYNSIEDDLSKHIFLTSLQDRNETIFYKLLVEHIKMLAPIIYTPTVAKACISFGQMYRRPRGMYFSTADRGEMINMVWNWPEKRVDVVVVTDGSRILGLGDLGVHGMAIPIGKLSLYVAGAGIDPAHVMPVTIDAGTNNPKLLADPLYLGLQHKRISGPEYFSLIDEFMNAIRSRWPKCLIQFEDFNHENALPLLNYYRDKQLCFNDDIQGTGAVALAGVLSGLKALGKKPEQLAQERIVCVGSGSAGLGVVNGILMGMIQAGVPEDEARKRFWMVDREGLVGYGRGKITQELSKFARSEPEWDDKLPLLDIVKRVKPTILLGLSGIGGLFTEPIIREMSAHTERPIIFPLSNPDTNSECSAQQAFEWSSGRAIVATGSPFNSVVIGGVKKTPCQGNNMFIFPGVGLGALVAQTSKITDKMFYVAAKTLASLVTEEELAEGKVYPDISNIRNVSKEIAYAVATVAFDDGLARKPRPEDLRAAIESFMYVPRYNPLIYRPLT